MEKRRRRRSCFTAGAHLDTGNIKSKVRGGSTFLWDAKSGEWAFFKWETKQVGKGLLHNWRSFTHTVQGYGIYLGCCCTTVPLHRPTSANYRTKIESLALQHCWWTASDNISFIFLTGDVYWMCISTCDTLKSYIWCEMLEITISSFMWQQLTQIHEALGLLAFVSLLTAAM